MIPFLIFCSLPLFVFIIPYVNFQNKEREAVAQFDTLNESVIAEVPPPNNALILHRNTIGITAPVNLHGRELFVEYDLSGMKTEEILTYYDTKLTQEGWKKHPLLSDDSYYRDHACISVYVQNDAELKDKFFRVRVWHDYYSQSFSPPVPWWFGWDDGDQTLSFYELLEMYGRVIRCP